MSPTVPGLSNEQRATLDAIFEPMRRSDAPGLVVGVARAGRPLYRQAFGLASVAQGVANTVATRMRIGSTTKHFTCVAALMLAEQGLLDLDAGIRRWLPDVAVPSGEPTLRQLMTHTSGLRCYIDLSFISHGMAVRARGTGRRTLARQGTANYPPGERMIYCNSGYLLLSQVIEQVSGQPLRTFLAERILQPMGMHDTELVPDDFETVPRLAELHVRRADGGYRRGVFPQQEFLGDGAMVSSMDDMLRWLAHLREPSQLLTPAGWAQLQARPRLNNGLLTRYGLGLQGTPYRGLDTVHHGGAVIGGACQMLTLPSHALDIVILSNGAATSPSRLAPRIIDALLGEALAHPATMARSQAHAAWLGATFQAPSGTVVSFKDADGQLGLCLAGNEPVPLRQQGAALRLEFEDAAVGPFDISFEADGSDSASPPACLLLSECGNAERAEHVSPSAPDLPALAAEIGGRYRCADLQVNATLTLEAGELLLRITGEAGFNTLRLTPVNAELLLCQPADPLVPLRGTLAVKREAGQVKGLTFNSTRTRGLAFERS